jgi:hypothetical protein
LVTDSLHKHVLMPNTTIAARLRCATAPNGFAPNENNDGVCVAVLFVVTLVADVDAVALDAVDAAAAGVTIAVGVNDGTAPNDGLPAVNDNCANGFLFAGGCVIALVAGVAEVDAITSVADPAGRLINLLTFAFIFLCQL